MIEMVFQDLNSLLYFR